VNVHLTAKRLVAFVFLFGAATVLAAAPSIGIATARGGFLIDDAQVVGNATLLEGSLVETLAADSDLVLSSGVELALSAGSRGQVFADRFLLQRGKARLEAKRPYVIEIAGIRVTGAARSAADIAATVPGRFEVATWAGDVRVTGRQGLLLARVAPGNALSFEPPDTAGSPPTKLSGILRMQDGHYLLTDETAGITVELQGAALDGAAVGKRVEVTGSVETGAPAAPGATQVIAVTSFKVIGAGTRAAHAGMSSGAKTAIVAGVIIGGAGTGAAIGLTRHSDDVRSISP
jgi:hypothetical protein